MPYHIDEAITTINEHSSTEESHAIPALVLDVALSEVAEDSIDAPVLSAVVVDALYFFLSIPVQLSCSSYGSSKRRSVKASS